MTWSPNRRGRAQIDAAHEKGSEGGSVPSRRSVRPSRRRRQAPSGHYSLLGGRVVPRRNGFPVFRARPTRYQASATAAAMTIVTIQATRDDKRAHAAATATAPATVLPIARRRHFATRSSRLNAFHCAPRRRRRSFTTPTLPRRRGRWHFRLASRRANSCDVAVATGRPHRGRSVRLADSNSGPPFPWQPCLERTRTGATLRTWPADPMSISTTSSAPATTTVARPQPSCVQR